uniref:Phosphatidylinositol-3-phosphatase SAC1 n=2 Tax=Schistosoma japonicum TaxID=6182 RepID=C1LH04_SCHJA|nr:Recessive suppressor of secretory defect [Schistosoma japonicum]
MVYEEYSLYLTPEHYYIKALGSKTFIVVDRISQELRVEFEELVIPVTAKAHTIYGIWGVIRLISGFYLIVIKERERVGEIFGNTIWKATKSIMLPFARSLLHLSDTQNKDESVYCQMLSSVLSTEGFYYSTTYDLSHTLQRLSDTDPGFKACSIYERADTRFTWNKFLLNEWETLLNSAASFKYKHMTSWNRFDYCVPIIQGYVGIISYPENYTNIQKGNLTYSLISRRSVYRTGTRFNTRGIDNEGNCANTVETEQLVEISGHRFSFVQLRGSVPIFWSQRPNLQYKPAVVLGGSLLYSNISHVDNPSVNEIEKNLETIQADIARQHFQKLIYDYAYGRQTIVNLLNQRGMEHSLGHAYAMAVLPLDENGVKYESFDFHRECGSTRWNRLGMLLERLIPELLRSKQLHLDMNNSGKIITRQTGTFRSNCIDCLDRTNVIQSMLSWCALEQAMIEIGLLHGTVSRTADASTTSPLSYLWPGFGPRFKSIWADNADYCSLQYAGTRALKTDFTRTGKRTFYGMLMDGYHSIVRYYLNNFSDGFRQDSMHLLLGHYKVLDANGNPKPLHRPTGSKRRQKSSDPERLTQFLPLIFSFTLAMSVSCCIFPTADWTEKATYVLFWGGASIISALAIFAYGDEFVDHPRFCSN